MWSNYGCDDGTRTRGQPGRPALPLDRIRGRQARGPARARLPECATPPEEVYALAKRRGMDFVTITDHDTIDGALAIADRPDVFVSEELTAGFRGEPQQVHVLCLGITPDDHDVAAGAPRRRRGRRRLPARARDRVRARAPVLRGRRAAHRRATGAGSPSCSAPGRSATARATPSSTCPPRSTSRRTAGSGIGGTDDHAGIDIGRTYSETPRAATPAAFLAHVRAGRVAGARRPGQRRALGAQRDGARGARARPRAGRRRRPTRARCCGWSSA